MIYPDILLNGGTDRVMLGMTNIYIDRKNRSLKITHAGEQGHTVYTIKNTIDKIYGKGSFDGLVASAKNKTESGTPSYLYTLTLEF